MFQKGFVEFFAEEEDVKAVEKKVAESGGWVDYLAANVEVRTQRFPPGFPRLMIFLGRVIAGGACLRKAGTQ